MEVEDFASQLERRLNEKNQESPTYRKASGVLASLMHAAKTIPNFKNVYANNTKTIALYLTAGVFKLLKRNLEGEQKHEHNLDAYLLLLTFVLPQTSPDALIQGGIINQLRTSMMTIMGRKDNTPLITRLATAILSHALAPTITTTDFKRGEDKLMLLDIFQKAVASPRSNALSRECSKLLVHLLKVNSSVSPVLAEESKVHLFSILQEKKQLYLSNVKEVMIELPVRLLNDICHRVASNLSDIDATDPSEENYLAQTYFFLEKMTPKLLPSTLEDLLLILIGSVPAGTQPERVQLSFLQLLYEATLALTQSNEHAANKIFSPIISILVQQLLISPKISKFSGNLLGFILSNCIHPSLWRHQEDEISLDMVNLDENGRNFMKIICHLQSLLSSRFTNTKMTATILSVFFSKLEADAANDCTEFIQKIVDYRTELGEKNFRKIFESILVAFGVEYIFSLYPLSLNGDMASQTFQESNNLWLLSILQKTDRSQRMGVFYKYIFPLIQTSKQYSEQQTLSKQRREGYQLIEGMMWRCIKIFSKVADTNINYEEVFQLIDGQIRITNDNTQQQLALALELLSDILAPLKYRSLAAEQLIKSLAGLLDITSANSRQLLMSIKGLSRLAPNDYIKRVFDKNIERLISLSESQSLTKEQDKNLKNLEILMAVNSAIDLSDPAVTTQFRISREELLLRLVSDLLNSSGTFQKKGYKYLNETLNSAPQSLYLEVLQLFESSIKIDNGAKYHRLSVIGKLWSWLRNGDIQENLEKIIGFIKSHLPEVLLSLRDHNKGARNEGIRIMEEFTDAMKEMDLIESFVESVCAGLIGERSQMKLATLTGLGVIIGKGYCTQQIFKEVVEIVLLLLKEKRQELYKGVVEFGRRGLFCLSIVQQKIYLPAILQNLFEEDEQGKMQHRSILRHFLIKLTKKHGREEIQQMIPQAHRKMLSHALKMQNREKRKKREQNIARRQYYEQQKEKERAEVSSDSQYEDQPIKEDNNNNMEIEGEHLEELDNTNNLLLKYDLEKEQFHFEKDQQRKIEAEKRKAERGQDEITFDDKGIMIVEDRKRQRIVNEQENEEEQTDVQQKDTLNFKKKPKTDVHTVKQSGDIFKSNRAGGDVRLKDKPEPYAFIQFNSKALNKRFKKRAEHVFESLFEKKQGGLRGLKSRIASGH